MLSYHPSSSATLSSHFKTTLFPQNVGISLSSGCDMELKKASTSHVTSSHPLCPLWGCGGSLRVSGFCVWAWGEGGSFSWQIVNAVGYFEPRLEGSTGPQTVGHSDIHFFEVHPLYKYTTSVLSLRSLYGVCSASHIIAMCHAPRFCLTSNPNQSQLNGKLEKIKKETKMGEMGKRRNVLRAERSPRYTGTGT